jgi:hypothetical protein
VAAALAAHAHANARFIAYVMPADLYVAALSMHTPPGAAVGHRRPSHEDQTR